MTLWCQVLVVSDWLPSALSELHTYEAEEKNFIRALLNQVQGCSNISSSATLHSPPKHKTTVQLPSDECVVTHSHGPLPQDREMERPAASSLQAMLTSEEVTLHVLSFLSLIPSLLSAPRRVL